MGCVCRLACFGKVLWIKNSTLHFTQQITQSSMTQVWMSINWTILFVSHCFWDQGLTGRLCLPWPPCFVSCRFKKSWQITIELSGQKPSNQPFCHDRDILEKNYERDRIISCKFKIILSSTAIVFFRQTNEPRGDWQDDKQEMVFKSDNRLNKLKNWFLVVSSDRHSITLKHFKSNLGHFCVMFLFVLQPLL